MDFNEDVTGYGSEEPKGEPTPDVTLCPSSLEYRTFLDTNTTVPCTRSVGHEPPHRHEALDGSYLEWAD